MDAAVERFFNNVVEAGISKKAAKPLGKFWRAHAVAMRPDYPAQWFKDNFKEIVRAETERENNLNEYGQPFRMSKKAKAEYAQKMKEVETFVKENDIKQAQNGKSFYFELNGKKYRVSNHTVEASNAGAFNSEGQQVRELYHPEGREGETQIFASPTRLIEIYNAIKDGKQVDGRGRIVGQSYKQETDLYTPEVQKLKKLQPIPVEEGILSAAVKEDAIGNAVREFRKKYPNGVVVNTIIGDVFIDGKSIKNSLSHFLYPSKFDVIMTLPDGMAKAAYMGKSSYIKNKIENHFFVYPVRFNTDDEVKYVICRVKKTAFNAKLYVHDVIDSNGIDKRIKKIASIQTQSPTQNEQVQLRGGNPYEQIIIDFFSNVKQNNNSYHQQDLGTTSWDEAGRATITLMQKADASTLIHESGHVFLGALWNDIQRGIATEQELKAFETLNY